MSQIAERYASALYQIAQEKKSAPQILDNLVGLGECLTQHDDIRTAFNSPLIANDDKVAMLKTALKNGMSTDFDSFISLLAKNNRLYLVPAIVEAFKTMFYKDSGTVEGQVRSAVELTDQEKTDLKNVIEEKLSKKVDLTYTVEKDMIGGIEAKVGSYIFEDSIKSHIEKLNEFITRRVQ